MANFGIHVFKSVILVGGEIYNPLKSLLTSEFLNLDIESNFSILYINGAPQMQYVEIQKESKKVNWI